MPKLISAPNVFLALVASASLAGMGACSESRPDLVSSGGTASGGIDSCATPGPGCECSDEGAQADCGTVKRVSGDYISCSMGKTTCAGGRYGECIGEVVTTRSLNQVTTKGLGGQQSCVGNPCAPDCVNQTDTPAGLDAGPGFKIDDAGLSLEGVLVEGGAACTSLTVSPPSPINFNVTNMAAANTLMLTPNLLPAGCYTGPVPALWSVDKFDIASVNAAGLMTLVTPIAGPIVVNAFAGTLSAAPVTVNVTVNSTDVSLAPLGIFAANFVGPGTVADNIEILYPYTNTMFPLGLPAPTLQWRNNGTAASGVEVTLRYPAIGAAIFSWSQIIPESTTQPATAIAAQPRSQIPQAAWFAFEQTVKRNRAVYGDAGIMAVQRLVGGVLRNEVTRQIRFADGQLKGRIYYNSYGTNLVQNYSGAYNGSRFGAATLGIDPGATTPYVVAGSTTANSSGCRVCHSVSANGNVLATCYENHNGVSYNLAATPITQASIGTTQVYGFPALSPDGSFMFGGSDFPGAYPAVSKLYALSGAAIPAPATQFTNLKAGTPAFSHDLTSLAFVFRSGGAAPVANPTSGPTTGDGKTLSMMNFNAATKQFSSFRNLYTPAAGKVAWPSFLPPGQNGIVFQREIIANSLGGWAETRSNCDARDAVCNNTGTTGQLMWVNTVGGAQPTVLANLNGVGLPTGPNLHGNGDASYAGTTPAGQAITVANFNDSVYNYEPTVLPITAGGYSWVAFTSRRMYGNIATINPYHSDPRWRPLSAQPTPKKIWIAAISNNPTPGTDPSFPAIYIPGQELLAGNSRAYFALEACKAPGPPSPANVCETDLDCCGGTAMPKTAICKLDTPIVAPPVRHCVSAGGGMCVADGAVCTLDSQCCGFASGSRCASGTCQVPPPIVTYASSTYERDYVATCPSAKVPVWRFFDWQAITPAGTSISFFAQTRDNTGTFGPQVPIGNALPPSTMTWTSAAFTVDQALRGSGQISKNVLRVSVLFNPKTSQPSATPTLTQWRQNYDCVDGE